MSYDCSPTGCHTPTPHHPHFYIIVGMVHGHEYVEQPSFAGRVAIPQTWAGGRGGGQTFIGMGHRETVKRFSSSVLLSLAVVFPATV